MDLLSHMRFLMSCAGHLELPVWVTSSLKCWHISLYSMKKKKPCLSSLWNSSYICFLFKTVSLKLSWPWTNLIAVLLSLPHEVLDYRHEPPYMEEENSSIGKVCLRESHKISKTVKYEFYHRQQCCHFVKVPTKSSSLNNHCLKMKNKRANYLKGACPWKKFYCLTMRQLFHNDSPVLTQKQAHKGQGLPQLIFLGFVLRDSTFLQQHWLTWYLLCSTQSGCWLA